MNDRRAYWNSSKCCWEIAITAPAGDRYEQVIKHANQVSQMLKDQGIKYIDAYIKLGANLHLLLLTDWDWYLDNEKDINSWAKSSNIDLRLSGMVLEFKNPEDKMMFMLRWT
jgi:hypothetical protein